MRNHGDTNAHVINVCSTGAWIWIKQRIATKGTVVSGLFSNVAPRTIGTGVIVDVILAPMRVALNVFDAHDDVPDFLCSAERTIAIRIPEHEGLRGVADSFMGLFSTSANITQDPTPKDKDSINPLLFERTQAFVEGDLQEGLASTIIDVSGIDFKNLGDGVLPPFRVLRHGAYPIEKLRALYEKRN